MSQTAVLAYLDKCALLPTGKPHALKPVTANRNKGMVIQLCRAFKTEDVRAVLADFAGFEAFLHQKGKLGKNKWDNVSSRCNWLSLFKTLLERVPGLCVDPAQLKTYSDAVSASSQERRDTKLAAQNIPGAKMLKQVEKKRGSDDEESSGEEDEEANAAIMTLIRWSDICDAWKAGKAGSVEQLVCGLYTLIPPRRGSDYRLMKLVAVLPAEEGNYICKEGDTYKISVDLYKTNFHGTFRWNLPAELGRIVGDYVRANDVQPGQYLIRRGDSDYSADDQQSPYSKLVKRSFDKLSGYKLNINSLRALLCSNLDLNRITAAEKNSLHYRMSHTAEVFEAEYHKIDPTSPPNDARAMALVKDLGPGNAVPRDQHKKTKAAQKKH